MNSIVHERKTGYGCVVKSAMCTFASWIFMYDVVWLPNGRFFRIVNPHSLHSKATVIFIASLATNAGAARTRQAQRACQGKALTIGARVVSNSIETTIHAQRNKHIGITFHIFLAGEYIGQRPEGKFFRSISLEEEWARDAIRRDNAGTKRPK